MVGSTNNDRRKENAMREVDLSTPGKIFRVPTSVTRGGVAYMGPDVMINANDAADARRRVAAAGHVVNPHFDPVEIGGRPFRL